MKITIESDQNLEIPLPMSLATSSLDMSSLDGGVAIASASNQQPEATSSLMAAHSAGEPPSWLMQEIAAVGGLIEIDQTSTMNGGSAPTS